MENPTASEVNALIARDEKYRASYMSALSRIERERAEVALTRKPKRLARFDRENAAWRRSVEENIREYDRRLARLRATLAATQVRDRAAAQKPSPGTAARYTLADVTETVQLCQLAGAPQLAAAFIASKTPVAKVRGALLKRADDARSMRPPATPRRAGPVPAAKPDFWGPIVADMNAARHRATNWEAVVFNAGMVGRGDGF